MAPHRGVWWEWWTVLRLSHAIQEVCHRLLIIVLSLKDATMDSTGELTLASGSVGQVTTLGEDLLSVGVSGFVHESMMAHPGGSRSSRGYKTGDSLIIRAYGSAATDIPPSVRIRISKNITLRIRSGSCAKYKTTTHE